MFKHLLSVQGRLHDLGLLFASAAKDVSQSPQGKQTRALLFKMYRYLNAAHFMGYLGKDIRVPTDPVDACNDLVKLGLLTTKEAKDLAAAHPKCKEVVISWLGIVWGQSQMEGLTRTEMNTSVHKQLCSCRGQMGAFGDCFDLFPSNPHTVILYISVGILQMMFMFRFADQFNRPNKCFQGEVVGTTFLITFCYTSLLAITHLMAKTPMDVNGDPINADALICSTAKTLFSEMRAPFSESMQRTTTLKYD